MSKVAIIRTPMFVETMEENVKKYGSRIVDGLAEFIKTKMANPTHPYGTSDKANPSGTPLAQVVPKIRHAHLTHDISIFYTISGANPCNLKLFAVLSHDQSGTGQPVNIKRQKSIGKQMSNQ